MAHPRSEEQLRARCLELVHELGLHPPLDLELLCRGLAESRGRRIKLTAGDLGSTTSVGHLVVQPHADRIIYERTAPRLQQAQVIYHEVMHLVLEHLEGGESLMCGLVIGDAGRSDPGFYAAWQEWEAETGATILSEMSRERSRPNVLPTPTRLAEQGIAAAFGFVSGNRR